MTPNIAFDLDGIVTNFSKPFIYWAKQRYDLTMISHSKFHWDTEPEITEKMFKNIIAEFISGAGRDLITPKKDGASLVEYVYSHTLRPITFVTARNKSTAGATHEWISDNFPSIDFKLSIVSRGSSKYRYIDDFDCFVDDRRKTAIDLATRGHVVFMPMREYNFMSQSEIDYSKFQVTRPAIWTNRMWSDPGIDHKNQIILLNDLKEMTSGKFDFMLFRRDRKLSSYRAIA